MTSRRVVTSQIWRCDAAVVGRVVSRKMDADGQSVMIIRSTGDYEQSTRRSRPTTAATRKCLLLQLMLLFNIVGVGLYSLHLLCAAQR